MNNAIDFTGRVGAEHIFLMDIPEQPKKLRGVWLATIETTDGKMVCFKDESTLSGLSEGKTEYEAQEKAKQYLKRVNFVESCHETKHDAYTLRFKEHEVFHDKLVIVDDSDSAFLWIDKYTGSVSFSGKYYHLYKEQRLVEALKRMAYAVGEFVERREEIIADRDELNYFTERFERALDFIGDVEREFKK